MDEEKKIADRDLVTVEEILETLQRNSISLQKIAVHYDQLDVPVKSLKRSVLILERFFVRCCSERMKL